MFNLGPPSPGMRPCPVCASPAGDNDVYCGICGTNFETETEEEAPVTTSTTREEVEAELERLRETYPETIDITPEVKEQDAESGPEP